MFKYGKVITSLFILTLFLCQGGVCKTLNKSIDTNIQKGHTCHNIVRQDNNKQINTTDIVLSPGHSMNSDCCFESAIGSGITNNQLYSVVFLVPAAELQQITNNPAYLTLSYLNKGHPPENPIYIQKSTYLI